jgi:hypothetical protein
MKKSKKRRVLNHLGKVGMSMLSASLFCKAKQILYKQRILFF